MEGKQSGVREGNAQDAADRGRGETVKLILRGVFQGTDTKRYYESWQERWPKMGEERGRGRGREESRDAASLQYFICYKSVSLRLCIWLFLTSHRTAESSGTRA